MQMCSLLQDYILTYYVICQVQMIPAVLGHPKTVPVLASQSNNLAQ